MTTVDVPPPPPVDAPDAGAPDAGAAAIDAAAVDARHWPDRPLTPPTADDRDGRFQVVYRQTALDAVHLHGQTRTDVELCGVLLGTGCRDAHGPYLLVEHAIPGTAASSRSTNVTFTADTWQQIQTVMDRDFPDKKMVGWYHTHPGFGIFLSGMDLFICDNFFNLPWQVAFVYDPVGGDEGNFVWRDGKPTREPVLLEDDVTPAAAAIPLMPLAEAMTGTDPAATVSATAGPAADAPDAVTALQSQVVELMERVGRLERRQRPLLVAVVFLLAFAAMWAVQQWPTMTTPDVTPAGAPPAPVAAPVPALAAPARPSVPQRPQGR